jgi:hypothetical protein
MKKVIALLAVSLISFGAQAQTKCSPDGRGGICCWDVQTQGPWKPISC